MPKFLAVPGPLFFWEKILILGSLNFRRIARLLSVDSSSIMITSNLGSIWHSTLSMHSETYSSLLYRGMTTEMIGLLVITSSRDDLLLKPILYSNATAKSGNHRETGRERCLIPFRGMQSISSARHVAA